MSFIDEAAREINVKVVWYGANAAAAVRIIAARTRPDLKREQQLGLSGGLSVFHLQFVPAALGEIRGFKTRFHLYAVESPPAAHESDEERLLLFRGADACVLIGGEDEGASLGRIDAVLAAHGYRDVPIVFAAPAHDAVARGRSLGFPDADDHWQCAYHATAIWVLGLEETRHIPDDVPNDVPSHVIHVVRPTSSEGFAVLTDGLSREAISRLELRADCLQHGWQIAMTVSFLGRLAFRQVRAGGPPWCAYDIVTTAEEPIFGVSHFVLAPAGSVNVQGETVTILRAVPITSDEHRDVAHRQLTGARMGAWLDERGDTMMHRWSAVLTHDRPLGGTSHLA